MKDDQPLLDDTIVGHKTYLGKDRMLFKHEPLTKREADIIIAAAERDEAKRIEMIPDQATGIKTLWDAYQRLKDFGWCDIDYCPKDQTRFNVLELGSTGIHKGYYYGEYPNGSIMIEDDDLGASPSTAAILFKPLGD